MDTKEYYMTRNLIDQYYRMISILQIDTHHYELDVVILKDIVKRYLRDVDRLHIFHKEITLIDCNKVAGYFTYWISKLKPIKVSNDAYRKHAKRALFINEMYSVCVAAGQLNDHLKSSKKRVDLAKSFFNSLMYTLKYRLTTGDNLAMLYSFIENEAIDFPNIENQQSFVI